MIQNKTKKVKVFLILYTLVWLNSYSQPICTWNPEKKELKFSLTEISGIISCDMEKTKGVSHHFNNVIYKPTNVLVSPDSAMMKHIGMLNFYRVLIEGGYLTELRAEESLLEPSDDGIKMIWMPTIRRQAKVIVKFTFKQPNIIDMDMSVETLTNYPAFEILLSSYHADGFETGVYLAKKEFGPIEPEQVRPTYTPMIQMLYPFFPRNEAGANTLTDGRHQKGRWFWRMAIGRRYALPISFISKNGVDALLMGRPDDVYAVGMSYEGNNTNDNVAKHRALYLSLFGEDFKAGEGRNTQMRMVIGKYNSDIEKHKELYETFIKEQEAKPRTFYINPEK
jgi:hypothetical protein